MNFDGFQKWLDTYSFIRDLIRNVALVPRMWSLDNKRLLQGFEKSPEKFEIKNEVLK